MDFFFVFFFSFGYYVSWLSTSSRVLVLVEECDNVFGKTKKKKPLRDDDRNDCIQRATVIARAVKKLIYFYTVGGSVCSDTRNGPHGSYKDRILRFNSNRIRVRNQSPARITRCRLSERKKYRMFDKKSKKKNYTPLTLWLRPDRFFVRPESSKAATNNHRVRQQERASTPVALRTPTLPVRRLVAHADDSLASNSAGRSPEKITHNIYFIEDASLAASILVSTGRDDGVTRWGKKLIIIIIIIIIIKPCMGDE